MRKHRHDNTDQGSQFTSEAFTSVLIANKVAISMDGKGAWRDNVFVERIWKSVKYEEVYSHAYDSVGVRFVKLRRRKRNGCSAVHHEESKSFVHREVDRKKDARSLD
jgi:transposase InsO family protein